MTNCILASEAIIDLVILTPPRGTYIVDGGVASWVVGYSYPLRGTYIGDGGVACRVVGYSYPLWGT